MPLAPSSLIALTAGGAGWGLVAWTAWQMLKFFLEFLAKRFDARQVRLDAQQGMVDGKIASRLRKLEQQVGALEQVATILIAEIREIDPSNKRLAEVHDILRFAHPIDPNTPEDMRDQLRRMP